MSSGFVSGGTSEAPIERSEEWLAAQREIDANIVAKQEAARATEGRSLFETLQANKAAKEEAFAEASKLKNQFRSLDEDEISFLDSVTENKRAEEERVKRETKEGLEAFRKQQEEAEKAGSGEEESKVEVVDEEWVAGGRKRKRARERIVRGVRRKEEGKDGQEKKEDEAKSGKIKSDAHNAENEVSALEDVAVPKDTTAVNKIEVKLPVEKTAAPKITGSGLGLVAYGSDSEDE